MNICMLVDVKVVFIMLLFFVCTLVASYFAANPLVSTEYAVSLGSRTLMKKMFFLQMVTDL